MGRCRCHYHRPREISRREAALAMLDPEKQSPEAKESLFTLLLIIHSVELEEVPLSWEVIHVKTVKVFL